MPKKSYLKCPEGIILVQKRYENFTDMAVLPIPAFASRPPTAPTRLRYHTGTLIPYHSDRAVSIRSRIDTNAVPWHRQAKSRDLVSTLVGTYSTGTSSRARPLLWYRYCMYQYIMPMTKTNPIASATFFPALFFFFPPSPLPSPGGLFSRAENSLVVSGGDGRVRLVSWNLTSSFPALGCALEKKKPFSDVSRDGFIILRL